MNQTQQPDDQSRPDHRFAYDPCRDYHWAFGVYMACKTDAARERWKTKLERIKSRIPKGGCP